MAKFVGERFECADLMARRAFHMITEAVMRMQNTKPCVHWEVTRVVGVPTCADGFRIKVWDDTYPDDKPYSRLVHTPEVVSCTIAELTLFCRDIYLTYVGNNIANESGATWVARFYAIVAGVAARNYKVLKFSVERLWADKPIYLVIFTGARGAAVSETFSLISPTQDKMDYIGRTLQDIAQGLPIPGSTDGKS